MSVPNGLWRTEVAYHLIQDNRSENVSVYCLRKIEFTYVLSQRVHCQRSIGCKKSNSHTIYGRTTTARMSAFSILWKKVDMYPLTGTTTERMSALSGLWKIEFAYPLSQDNHGKNISVKWLVKSWIHIPSKPGQPRGERQRAVAYEKSNSRAL